MSSVSRWRMPPQLRPKNVKFFLVGRGIEPCRFHASSSASLNDTLVPMTIDVKEMLLVIPYQSPFSHKGLSVLVLSWSWLGTGGCVFFPLLVNNAECLCSRKLMPSLYFFPECNYLTVNYVEWPKRTNFRNL